MRTSSANAAPARNPAHLCSPARRAAGGTNSCEIECRNCAWTYDRWVAGKAVPGEARVAGRRGVWLVVIFITIAVARFGGRPGVHRAADGAPTVGGIEFDARPAGRRRPPGGRARRTGRLVLRTAAHRPFRRRVAAQGQGRSPHHQRRHPADRHRGAVGARCRRCATRSSTSSRRRSRSSRISNTAASRSSTSRAPATRSSSCRPPRSISPAWRATSCSCAARSTRSAPIPTRCTSASTRRRRTR